MAFGNAFDHRSQRAPRRVTIGQRRAGVELHRHVVGWQHERVRRRGCALEPHVLPEKIRRLVAEPELLEQTKQQPGMKDRRRAARQGLPYEQAIDDLAVERAYGRLLLATLLRLGTPGIVA